MIAHWEIERCIDLTADPAGINPAARRGESRFACARTEGGIAHRANTASGISSAVTPRIVAIPFNCRGHPQFAFQFANCHFLVHNLLVISIVPALSVRE